MRDLEDELDDQGLELSDELIGGDLDEPLDAELADAELADAELDLGLDDDLAALDGEDVSFDDDGRLY